jgi:hypothetical protein
MAKRYNEGKTTMKLTTLALASALALSTTAAFAATGPAHHHRSGVRIHHSVIGMGYAPMYRGSMNYYSGPSGGPNNRGGLVGGDDSGTYKP